MDLSNLERWKSNRRAAFVGLLGGWLSARTDPWRGSATELAGELGRTSTGGNDCIPTAHAMASALAGCAAALAGIGWAASRSRTGRCRTIRFDRTGGKA